MVVTPPKMLRLPFPSHELVCPAPTPWVLPLVTPMSTPPASKIHFGILIRPSYLLFFLPKLSVLLSLRTLAICALHFPIFPYHFLSVPFPSRSPLNRMKVRLKPRSPSPTQLPTAPSAFAFLLTAGPNRAPFPLFYYLCPPSPDEATLFPPLSEFRRWCPPLLCFCGPCASIHAEDSFVSPFECTYLPLAPNPNFLFPPPPCELRLVDFSIHS